MADTIADDTDAGAPASPPTPPPRAGVLRPGLAGATAALCALAAGELVSAIPGTDQSLVAGVGTAFIDRFAGSLKDLAVELFGTNDKAALIIGIVIVSALAGVGLGVGSVRRPWVGPAGIAAFGVVGLAAGFADPLASKPVVVAAAVTAVLVGVAVLRILLRVARTGQGPVATLPAYRTVEYPNDPRASRRAFFGWTGAAGAFAVTAGAAGRALSGRSAAEIARANVQLPPVPGVLTPGSGDLTAVEGLTSYYVPNAQFYRIDTALVVPQVDPATWRLRVTGLVERELELTFDDLLGLPMVEEAVTLSCVSNEVGGDLVGNARWQGVRLTDVLDRAGVRADASQVVGVSVDGFTAGFPTEVIRDGRPALVAVGMNGEPLPVRHGFPARLVVSGLYGYVSATKWLEEIRLTRWEDFDGYWMDKGWSKEGPVKTQSRIDVPRLGMPVAPGPTKIAGVAWAPSRGISKVEVQVDDGVWMEARLGTVVSDDTWVQWVVDWDAPAGRHTIRVRATDGRGETQTNQFARPDPNGATGWHRITVDVG